MFSFQDTRAGDVVIDVALTDRHDGPLGAPLDLSEPPTGENTDALEASIGVVVDALTRSSDPVAVVRTRQVHGADVLVVDRTRLDRPDVPEDLHAAARLDEADAMVTALPGVVLLVRAADCVPLLLGDPATGVVGAVHAGRQGLVADVVGRTVASMRSLGAGDIEGWVGPHVCGRCYEVPAGMRAEVADAVPAAWAETSWGTPAVDLGAGVRAQLDAAGVPHRTVDRCTREDADLWSHRRDGPAAGRLGGLVWVRP